MSAFLFCFAAWLAMALGMDKHHEDALGREGFPARLRHLRSAGWVILLASLWLATRTPAACPPPGRHGMGCGPVGGCRGRHRGPYLVAPARSAAGRRFAGSRAAGVRRRLL